ncbi:MAG: peptide chain release factor 1 [Erysipelotrichaceae bacterium]|jgi:peptide chain release factor 1|nr:peptide chain release factor 1 [Erysipelotrichaceae bacterium]MBQ3963550.1 peptide chain release factor 1 [Erysipelotrichaceae bacterium]MBQ5552357.1 peptide chain release factor 1 [Erysipelotrichaceae bacterium]
MDAKIIKLQEIEKRYLEINDLLMQEENVSDVKKFTKLSKEQASLKAAYEAYQNYKKYTAIVEDGQEMLKDPDPEIREMAETEISDAKENLEKLDKHIEELLLPRDPEDAYDCIVEIRGAAGGDEGNIFAGDLFRMYSYYAESLGYKVEVMESSEGEAGGYALISFQVKGLDAYRHFKFESGAHRVQRVPKTETQGRVHTSTATVIVFPDVEEEDVEIPDSDLEIETHRASGAGGQHINKTDSAVRIVHKPTGITVNCQDGRNQIANKETALRIIRARVYDYYKQKKEEEEGRIRRSKIGTGDRSEKIRTYNYPQNRVSDHRIGLTINQLDRIMEGKLDDIVNALLANDDKEKLLNENV